MFDDIAPHYDFLNTVLSLTIHRQWRRVAARCAALMPGDAALDVCSGTGDFACDLRRIVGPSGHVIGSDFSSGMLAHGAKKFARHSVPRVQADAARLPFASNSFQASVVGFGLRNVALLEESLAEMVRVVAPGGRVVCLEFAEPHPGLFAALYHWYGTNVLPKVGKLVSGSPEAYTYLPESVARWKSRTELANIMQRAGLADIRTLDLALGIVCVHVGSKI
jgi:demethylmenaquinone methyltransferase/2-methoxy-6-polyprenyl-1,4-benzoquinol methylase